MEIRKTSMNLRKSEDAALRGSVSALRFTGLATGAYAKTARKTAKQTVRSAGVLREAAEGRDLKAAKGGFTQADTERYRALSGRQRRRVIRAAERAAREEVMKGAPASRRPEIFAEQLKAESRKILPVRYAAQAPEGETVKEMRKSIKRGEFVTVSGYAKNKKKAQKEIMRIRDKYKAAVREKNIEARKRFASVASREILKEYRSVRQREITAAQSAMDERSNESGVSRTVARRSTVIPRAGAKYGLRKTGGAVQDFVRRKMRDIGAALLRIVPNFIRLGLAALAPMLMIPILVLPIVVVSTFVGSSPGVVQLYGSLEIDGVYVTPLSYYTYYESGGRYDAVLGGREQGCCGAYQFHYRYELQPFIDYAVNTDPVQYSMLAPYTSANASREELKANQGLASAWQQAYAMNPNGFKSLQDQYVYDTKWVPIRDFHAGRGLNLDSRPEVIKGLILSIHNRMGLETNSLLSIIIRSGVTNNTSDSEFISMLCDTFAAAYPGSDIYDRYVVDYSSAARGFVCEKTMALNILNGEYQVSLEGNGQLLMLTPERFVQEVAAVAEMARLNNYTYGHSSTQIPCADGFIACDRLESRALWNLGFTDQRAGGEIVESLIPYLQAKGAITIYDQTQVQRGDIVIMCNRWTGRAEHAFTVAYYDPVTGVCQKYDEGEEWRIHVQQPFTTALNEWTDRRDFMMALRMPGVIDLAA